MSQHSGHLSADDDDDSSGRSRSSSGASSDSSSSSSSDDHGGRGGGGAVMSIFASYYGIEETAAPQMKGTIDDANFDSETFVRGLLVQEPMEGLVMKDAEIVNDIRNLDGEMQKLVYDNYHKFITATETIKDMKNDKIKERTEAMMSDLTKKVIALLDDPSLEAIKMTQYVTVLRLMHAPTETVAWTLVRAHQQRAKRLVAQYEQRVAPILAPSAGSAASGAQPPQLLTAEQAQQLLSDSREFHQLILVGAIEACKAVTELFPAAGSSASTAATAASTVASGAEGTEPQPSPQPQLREQVYRDLQELLRTMLHEYTQAITRVFRVFLTHYETAHRQRSATDASASYATEFADVLRAQGVTGSAGAQWMRHLQAKMDDIQRLYARTAAATATDGATATDSDRDDAAEAAEAEAAASTAQENRHEAVYLALQAARAAWHTLARQILSDVVFLDRHLRDTARHLHLHLLVSGAPGAAPAAPAASGASGATAAGTVKPLSFTTETGDVWVRLWRGHYHVMLGQHVHRYVAHLVDEWGAKALLALLTVAHPMTTGAAVPPVAQRLPLFQEQLVWMQRVWTLLCDRLVETFQDALHETKPLLDLFEVTQRPIDEEHWPLVLLSEFLEALTVYCEDAVGIEDHHRLRYALETHPQALGSGSGSGHSGSGHSGSSHVHRHRTHSHGHSHSHSGGSARRKDSLNGGDEAGAGAGGGSGGGAAATAAAAAANSRRAVLEEEEDVFAVAWYSGCPVRCATTTSGQASAHPSQHPAHHQSPPVARPRRHHRGAWLAAVGWQVPAETSLLVALLLKRLATPSASAATALGAGLQEISLHVQARLLKHVDAAHRLCYHHFLHQNVLHAQQQTQRWLMALYQHYYYVDQVAAWTYLCLGEALPGASAAGAAAGATGAAAGASTPTGAGHVNALSGGSGGGGSGGAAGGGAMRRASLLPAAAVGVAGVNATAASVGGAVGRRASLTASVSTSTSLGGGGSSSVHGGLGRALQLDLDRLFAAKIVCVPNTLHVEKLSHSLFAAPGDHHGDTNGAHGSGNGSGSGGVVAVSVEVILGAILKATIKSGEELTRLLQLPSAASHTHLQQHAHFLRLLSPSLLRDPRVAAGDAPLWLLVADVWHPLLPPDARAAVTQRFPPRVRPVAPSVPLPASPWPWPSPFVDAPLRPSTATVTATVSVAVTATPSTLDTAALLARDRGLVDRWLNVDAADGPTPLSVAFFADDVSTRSALRTVAASASLAAEAPALGGACGVVCFDATRPVYAHIEAQLSRLVTQLGADVVVVCVALHPPPPPSSSSGGDDRSAVAQRVTRRFGRPTIDVDVVDADGRGHAAVLSTLATLLVAQWRANGTWAALVDRAANPPPPPVLKPPPLERPPRPFCIVS
eukprot:gene12136-8680_t